MWKLYKLKIPVMTNDVRKIRDKDSKEGGGSGFQPLVLAVVLILGIFVGRYLTGETGTYASSKSGNSGKIIDLINRIEDKYVDEVDQDELVEKAITTMLEDLDPHSYYINYDDYKSVAESLEGKFEGIGVEFMIHEDTLHVVTPIRGGPSYKAGILPGDMIIEVDGEKLSGTGISTADVTEALKGPADSKVKVGIKRRGEPELIEITLVRDEIPIKSVVAKFMVDDETGYIKVSRFARTTGEEFSLALDELSGKGMKSLVLDLRSNGGGLMHSAISMVQEFLDKNELIVFTRGKNNKEIKEYTRYNGKYRDIDLVVLINQGSASASEIVAGALQDHDRAITVGRRSFGKGLVQNELLLRDSSVVRLTVARYYTPSGRCIQKPYGDGIDYDGEYVDRYHNGELMDADSIEVVDSLRYETDMGRSVYGGGGITPDVFVPIDTIGLSDYFRELNYAQMFRNFGYRYVDMNRGNFSYKDFYEFDENFEVGESLMDEFIQFAVDQGVAFDADGLLYSRELIALRVKSHIGKNLFDDQALYFVNLDDDLDYKKAFEVLKNYDRYMEEWMAEVELKMEN